MVTGLVLLMAGERVALSLKINRQVGGVVIGVVAVLELEDFKLKLHEGF